MPVLSSNYELDFLRRLPNGLGAGLWTPAVSSSIDAWWDFDDASTITIGTGVSQIDDKTGNGNHLAQGTAGNQPTYDTSGDIAFASFDSSDSLQLTNLACSDAIDIYIVMDINDPSQFIPMTINVGGTLNHLLACDPGSTNTNVNFGSFGNPTHAINGNKILIADRDEAYTLINGTGKLIYKANNVEVDLLSGAFGFRISGHSATWAMVGDIYDCVVIDAAAPIEEKLKLEGWLHHKHSLQSELPPAHPYRNSAPLAADPAYSPFSSGAEVILDLQNSSSITLNGSDISEVANQASTKYGDFEQVNAVQQPLYNTDDSDTGGFKTMDTDDGVSTKQGLEAQDSITFGDFYFVMTYKDGSDSTFDSYSNLISDPVTTSNRIIGDTGTANLYTINTFTNDLEVNGSVATNTILPMPFSVVRASSITAGTGVLDLFFVESAGTRDWEGSLAYMTIFPEKLDTENSDKVTGYLSHEFELTDSLALGHPYKTSRPKTSSPAFSPWDYNPITWIKSDSLSITLNSSDVSSIEDRGRSRNNFSQGTASEQPLFDSANEKMLFDGTEYLTCGDVNTFRSLHESGGTVAIKFNLTDFNSGDLSVLFATQTPTSAGIGCLIGIDDRAALDNAAYLIIGRGIFGTANVAYETSTGGATYNLGISDTDDHTLIVTYDATDLKIYLDGSLEFTVLPKNAFATGSSSQAASLGSDPLGSWGFDGGISETVISENKLDDAGALELHNYLMN